MRAGGGALDDADANRFRAAMDLLIATMLAAATLALFVALGRSPMRGEFGGRFSATLATTFLLGTLAAIVFMPVTRYGQDFELDPTHLTMPILLSGQIILSLFLLVWWALRRPPGSFFKFLHVGGGSIAARLQAGVAAGVTGWVVAVAVNITLGSFFSRATGGTGGEEIPEVVRWLAALPLTSKLMIIGAAMTAEEAFFRGFLQPRVGAVPSTVLFALGHFSYGLPFLVLGVLTISIVLARTFEKEGDLLPCIVAHGVFDAIQLLVILPLTIQAAGQG